MVLEYKEDDKRTHIPNALNNPGSLKREAQICYITPPGVGETSGEKRTVPFIMGRGGHSQFENPQDGLVAMRMILEEQYNRQGIRTVQSIFEKYAPSSDGNNTSGYIAGVCAHLGVKPDEELNLNDPKVVRALMRGIAHKEGALIEPEQGDLWSYDEKYTPQYTSEMFDYAVQCTYVPENEFFHRRGPEKKDNKLVARRRIGEGKFPGKSSNLSDKELKQSGNPVYDRARARLLGHPYANVSSRPYYATQDLARMKGNVMQMMNVGLLPAENQEQDSMILLYRLQQVNRMTGGKSRISVDGQEMSLHSYLSQGTNISPRELQRMLKSDNLTMDDLRDLAPMLRRVNQVVDEKGTVRTVIRTGSDVRSRLAGAQEAQPHATARPGRDVERV